MACLIWFCPESPVAFQEQAETGGEKESLFQMKYLMPMIVSVLLMVFQQFSGINAILSNLSDLYTNAGVDLSPGYASVIPGMAQVIANLSTGMMVQKFGRKIIWNASFILMVISGILFSVSQWPGAGAKFPAWMPIAFIFIFLLGFGLGAGPIPWFLINEMFGDDVRPTAAQIITISNWICAFLVMQTFPEMVGSKMGLHGALLFFAVIAAAGVVFGIFYVKTPEALEERMNREKDVKDVEP
jgi:hypothetical protein